MGSGADSFSLKGAKDAILISDASAASGVLFRNMSILRNSNFWHGFVIHNVRNYERDEVLKVILDRVFPLDLIPVHYESNNGEALFLARNCAEAVQKLCKDNLIVPNPDVSSIPFKLEIYLRFATLANVRIDAQKNVSAVLNQRFCPLTKTLNLNLFHSDPNLSEYSPLSQPKIMYFVLHIANNLQATSIKLCNNGIRTMFPIEALWGSNISSLDLRYNLLDSISQLEPLKLLNISELWLDGNPLCNNYEEYSYVQRIKEMLPKLEKLDGVLLIQNGFPALRRNSLCNLDGHQLVDHFLEYYFTLYDSKNRQMLEGLYHKNAIFSLTTLYKSGQNSSSTCQMQKYQMYARNLRLLADLSKSDQFLFRGNTNIIKLLNRLPSTEHDPYSFTTDLMYYNVNVSGTVCAGVCITGVFREPAENLLDHERLLGFNRTFVLEGVNDEFCITNEMLHVYNALNIQENRCFQIAKRLPDVILPPASTPKEKQKLNESLQLIAGLTPEWSRKCLEDADYDLKKAISVFVDLYKVDKIPVVAFKNKEDAGYVANNKPAYTTPNATALDVTEPTSTSSSSPGVEMQDYFDEIETSDEESSKFLELDNSVSLDFAPKVTLRDQRSPYVARTMSRKETPFKFDSNVKNLSTSDQTLNVNEPPSDTPENDHSDNFKSFSHVPSRTAPCVPFLGVVEQPSTSLALQFQEFQKQLLLPQYSKTAACTPLFSYAGSSSKHLSKPGWFRDVPTPVPPPDKPIMPINTTLHHTKFPLTNSTSNQDNITSSPKPVRQPLLPTPLPSLLSYPNVMVSGSARSFLTSASNSPELRPYISSAIKSAPKEDSPSSSLNSIPINTSLHHTKLPFPHSMSNQDYITSTPKPIRQPLLPTPLSSLLSRPNISGSASSFLHFAKSSPELRPSISSARKSLPREDSQSSSLNSVKSRDYILTKPINESLQCTKWPTTHSNLKENDIRPTSNPIRKPLLPRPLLYPMRSLNVPKSGGSAGSLMSSTSKSSGILPLDSSALSSFHGNDSPSRSSTPLPSSDPIKSKLIVHHDTASYSNLNPDYIRATPSPLVTKPVLNVLSPPDVLKSEPASSLASPKSIPSPDPIKPIVDAHHDTALSPSKSNLNQDRIKTTPNPLVSNPVPNLISRPEVQKSESSELLNINSSAATARPLEILAKSDPSTISLLGNDSPVLSCATKSTEIQFTFDPLAPKAHLGKGLGLFKIPRIKSGNPTDINSLSDSSTRNTNKSQYNASTKTNEAKSYGEKRSLSPCVNSRSTKQHKKTNISEHASPSGSKTKTEIPSKFKATILSSHTKNADLVTSETKRELNFKSASKTSSDSENSKVVTIAKSKFSVAMNVLTSASDKLEPITDDQSEKIQTYVPKGTKSKTHCKSEPSTSIKLHESTSENMRPRSLEAKSNPSTSFKVMKRGLPPSHKSISLDQSESSSVEQNEESEVKRLKSKIDVSSSNSKCETAPPSGDERKSSSVTNKESIVQPTTGSIKFLSEQFAPSPGDPIVLLRDLRPSKFPKNRKYRFRIRIDKRKKIRVTIPADKSFDDAINKLTKHMPQDCKLALSKVCVKSSHEVETHVDKITLPAVDLLPVRDELRVPEISEAMLQDDKFTTESDVALKVSSSNPEKLILGEYSKPSTPVIHLSSPDEMKLSHSRTKIKTNPKSKFGSIRFLSEQFAPGPGEPIVLLHNLRPTDRFPMISTYGNSFEITVPAEIPFVHSTNESPNLLPQYSKSKDLPEPSTSEMEVTHLVNPIQPADDLLLAHEEINTLCMGSKISDIDVPDTKITLQSDVSSNNSVQCFLDKDNIKHALPCCIDKKEWMPTPKLERSHILPLSECKSLVPFLQEPKPIPIVILDEVGKTFDEGRRCRTQIYVKKKWITVSVPIKRFYPKLVKFEADNKLDSKWTKSLGMEQGDTIGSDFIQQPNDASNNLPSNN